MYSQGLWHSQMTKLRGLVNHWFQVRLHQPLNVDINWINYKSINSFQSRSADPGLLFQLLHLLLQARVRIRLTGTDPAKTRCVSPRWETCKVDKVPHFPSSTDLYDVTPARPPMSKTNVNKLSWSFSFTLFHFPYCPRKDLSINSVCKTCLLFILVIL